MSTTSSSPSLKTTPMMAQWTNCKNQVPDTFLLFRLGDFYEAFHEDAVTLSALLDLTLTKRQEVPMCGIPWHSSESYIEKLVSLGHSVAIAEQIESTSSSLMERQIVRVLSPGTTLSPNTTLPHHHSLFIALFEDQKEWAASAIDVTSSTFEGFVEQDIKVFTQEIAKRKPKELLVSQACATKNSAFLEQLQALTGASISKAPNWMFDLKSAEETLKNHFQVLTLDSFGFNDKNVLIQVAGAHISYLKNTLLFPVETLASFTLCEKAQFMQLDRSTIENLELFESTSTAKNAKNLFELLNTCHTPMGSRTLRSWLLFPLLDLTKIIERQQDVQSFIDFSSNTSATVEVEKRLRSIRDMERTYLRIHSGNFSPRDVASLGCSLLQLEPLKKALETSQAKAGKTLLSLPSLDTLGYEIEKTLQDNLPLRTTEGNLIKAGIKSELDELRAIKSDANSWLLSYQSRLREELDIRTLKVGFTRAFGYYIEVTRALADKMPSSFMRRQTLTNQERFISEELKVFEQKVFSAEAKIIELETQIFDHLVTSVRKERETILAYAKAIGQLDLLFAFSQQAISRKYSCPNLTQNSSISITQGRHPILEASSHCPIFTPNDLFIDSKGPSLLLLTGPNMGGKSTYIRQAALLTIMAQIGSFIPAEFATIGLVDKVMSRIGASDDLARGQSTFMVEMTETAHILRTSTPRSLILLDEIGRGTSTFDGIAIARAVCEYLLASPEISPKTLFATHYFELTSLEEVYKGRVENRTVAVTESKKGIEFLHLVIKGKADRSYGIHVASLAGMPQEVLRRAEEFLLHLETSKRPDGYLFEIKPKINTKTPDASLQCYTFLKQLDLLKLSPLECFSKLLKFKETLQ